MPPKKRKPARPAQNPRPSKRTKALSKINIDAHDASFFDATAEPLIGPKLGSNPPTYTIID